MPIIARDDDLPTGPAADQRLVWERAVRAQIRLLLGEVLANRWHLVWSLWEEAVGQGEWFSAAVWAGLPNTVRERLRELQHENRRAD